MSNAIPQRNEAAAKLLLDRLLQGEEGFYGAALKGKQEDLDVTRFFAELIQSKLKALPEEGSPDWQAIRAFSKRSALALGYAKDDSVPASVREFFNYIALVDASLREDHQNDVVVSSMDIGHWAGTFNKEAGVFELSQMNVFAVPRVVGFATLLMNPRNPTNPKDPVLPLQEGRMEAHAQVLSEVSGISAEEHIRAAFLNVGHIAGWRYGKTTSPEQLGFDYFVQCAERANDAGQLGIDPDLFDRVLKDAPAPKF